VSNDDLYIGPTVLAPGPPKGPELADHLAKWIVVPLIVCLIAVVLVFYVFFSSAVVSGQSMDPTLSNGDYLLITHGASGLQRGDIIVTKVLEDIGPVELVKRVIALPGDTVEVQNDVAIVNGIAEPQRGQFVVPSDSVSRTPIVVPPGTVYVMGDNRPVSEDSRYLGPVPISGIQGRAVFVFAPLTRIHPM
jgi:signal peptidase I